MIRINLLAKKTSKKKAFAIQHLAIGVGAIVVLAAVLGWIWVKQSGELTKLNAQIATQLAEKERLKNVNDEKNRFEAEKAELERKLSIITMLQKQRIVPVHLLDELTRVFDASTPIWISNFNFTAGGVSFDGMSLSNEALRPMVDNLEKSPYYKGVELLYSERTELQGREVFRFSIRAGVEQPD